ncbi:hypothetical protein K491DRAFT_699373 [Lophiostoma macrostomum CBS 122681]|uniref:Uncharacterized protein n=1 Tax=Lophiostoma macrostomum CBS 122681 TaxID=1314788 RepID=A0A6A6SNB3_9PLEO|nr:hypothetical protein K491DRAFT_699373 [Lophiostoma macrostomum CBS 122681]
MSSDAIRLQSYNYIGLVVVLFVNGYPATQLQNCLLRTGTSPAPRQNHHRHENSDWGGLRHEDTITKAVFRIMCARWQPAIYNLVCSISTTHFTDRVVDTFFVP